MAEEKKHLREEKEVHLVRILGQDIPGDRNVYSGLARIKGISWSISNVACKKLDLGKDKKIEDLSKDEIKKIEDFLKGLDALDFLKNRQKDFDTGKTEHLLSTDLDLRKEFDIKRLKKIKSYRGMRHSLKLPVRGQRTRSNFRKSGTAVGVKRPKMGKKS